MAREKVDGVVEAARYLPDGRLEVVRVYERRGPTWSDRILLTREQLVERVRSGLVYRVGQRQRLMGGTFQTGPAVRVLGSKDAPVLATSNEASEHDDLQGVPRF